MRLPRHTAVYIRMHTSTYVCIRQHVAHCCLHASACVYVCVKVLQRCVCVHVGERVCACMHGCTYRGIHVCVHVYVDMCVCMCT